MPLLGLGNRQGHHSLKGHVRGWNPYHGVPPTTWLLVVASPKSKESLPPFMLGRKRIIYNWPPSRPHLIAFYDMQGEGCLSFPLHGTLLLRPPSRFGFGFTAYWMFYDHLSAHSPLPKLGRWGWLMRTRSAWKRSRPEAGYTFAPKRELDLRLEAGYIYFLQRLDYHMTEVW